MRKTTNDEGEIRLWASRGNAHPIEKAPFIHDGEPAFLGFIFGNPAISQESLRPISWSQFFAMFHLMGLVLVYDYENQSEFELLKVEGKTSGTYNAVPMQA